MSRPYKFTTTEYNMEGRVWVKRGAARSMLYTWTTTALEHGKHTSGDGRWCKDQAKHNHGWQTASNGRWFKEKGIENGKANTWKA